MKTKLLVLSIIIFFAALFSYRLLQIPMGLTGDEAAFGYNAALLAHNGHDQNGRFMPFFVLSLDGSDWRQPLTQYYLALLFKVFGSSIFLLRFSSITIMVVSSLLLYYLTSKLLNPKTAIFAVIIFVTTPTIVMQSRLGLDNIMPVPFVLLWLIGLYNYSRTKKLKWAILAGLAMGLNFYSYKGLRATVPVWSILSCLYLWLNQKSFKSAFYFGLAVFPFLAVAPYLNHLYPGSILGGSHPDLSNVYDIIYGWISSFDPGYLFIKGDTTLYHSTQYHGMFLLASLPIFVAGLYYGLKQKSFWSFILLAFITAPLLYGVVDSVHRFSRLLDFVPMFCLISALGWDQLVRSSKKYATLLTILILVAFAINFGDFYHYYLNDYRKLTQSVVGTIDYYPVYPQLVDFAKKYQLTPAIDQDTYKGEGESGHFFEAVYFPDHLTKVDMSTPLPINSLILTHRSQINGYVPINPTPLYRDLYFQKPQ